MQLYSPLWVYNSQQQYWYISFLLKVAYSFECDCVSTMYRMYIDVIMKAPLLLYGTRTQALETNFLRDSLTRLELP